MSKLLSRCFLFAALTVAGWSLSGAANADGPNFGIQPSARSMSNPELRLARRWWRNSYWLRPYWDGGNYQADPYSGLYYRRIAPGVYYYF